MNRELMKQCLAALDVINHEFICRASHHSKKDRHYLLDECPIVARHEAAIEALKQELAKPDPEPVATVKTINGVWIGYLEKRLPDGTPLYLGAPIVDKDTASW